MIFHTVILVPRRIRFVDHVFWKSPFFSCYRCAFVAVSFGISYELKFDFLRHTPKTLLQQIRISAMKPLDLGEETFRSDYSQQCPGSGAACSLWKGGGSGRVMWSDRGSSGMLDCCAAISVSSCPCRRPQTSVCHSESVELGAAAVHRNKPAVLWCHNISHSHRTRHPCKCPM
jgi:hypothetical protein